MGNAIRYIHRRSDPKIKTVKSVRRGSEPAQPNQPNQGPSAQVHNRHAVDAGRSRLLLVFAGSTRKLPVLRSVVEPEATSKGT